MLRNVELKQGIFTANDETGRKVIIPESISFVFKAVVSGKGKRQTVTFEPIDFRRADILEEVVNFLCGREYDGEIIETIVIRFGWMDKRLNKLSFINITDWMSKIRAKEATSSERRKLVDLCKQLSLSQKYVLK